MKLGNVLSLLKSPVILTMLGILLVLGLVGEQDYQEAVQQGIMDNIPRMPMHIWHWTTSYMMWADWLR